MRYHHHRFFNSELLLFLFIVFLFTSSSFASTKSLFNDIDLSNAITQPLAENAFKQKAVSIDTKIFETLKLPKENQTDIPDVLLIDLFNGERITAVLDKSISVSATSVSWVGHIKGNNQDQVVLTISDDVVMGTINQGSNMYQIRYVSPGNDYDATNHGAIHTLKHIDPSKTPQDHPDEYPNGVLKEEIQGYIESEQKTDAKQSSDTQADDGSVIDVMVVYTPAARNAAGGTTAMNTLIDLAVTETIQGYSTSGINTTINLVHKEEVSYTEASTNAFSTALSQLRNTSDGIIDNVHTLRDTYAADLVALLIQDPQYCGIGYLNSSAATAFTVTAYNCATGYYSFAHEFGHNHGARHDWRVDQADTHKHGYVNLSSDWRTIMAYNDSSCPGGYCTRLNFWSNPDRTHNGEATGVPVDSYHEADNRKTINDSAYTVANFRTSNSGESPSITSPLPSPSSTLSALTETFTWNAAGETVQQWWLFAGSSAGGHDYFVGGNGASTEVTVTGLPTDGSTVYITIWYQVAGVWSQLAAHYTAANIGSITSPTSGSSLSEPSEVFYWNPGSATVQQWWLFAGSSEDDHDYFVGGNTPSTNVTVTGLPTDGSTVYITIWYQIAGNWGRIKATYTAANIGITSPTSGSSLSGSSQLFSWSSGSGDVQQWWLFAGSSLGAYNYFLNGGNGSATNASVTGLPTDGSTVYIQLWLQISGNWVQVNETYTAANPR